MGGFFAVRRPEGFFGGFQDLVSEFGLDWRRIGEEDWSENVGRFALMMALDKPAMVR